MWIRCFFLSVFSLIAFAAVAMLLDRLLYKTAKRVSIFNMLFAGLFVASFFMFMPINAVTCTSGAETPVIMSVLYSLQMFALGMDFTIVNDGVSLCTEWLAPIYRIWAAVLFVAAPFFSFGFVLSFFKNVTSFLKYTLMYFKEVYVFSDLNEKSLTLAADIKNGNRNSVVVFNDVSEDDEEQTFEMIQRVKKLGAICFKKDILAVAYGRHSSKTITFFTIGQDEGKNLSQAIRLVELYKTRKNTHIYAFSTKLEGEILLDSVDKGEVRVRRINEVQSLINRVLYERGELIFKRALPAEDGIRDVSAVVVGLGSYGTEMLKALTWFGQMDGYRLLITAFDKNPNAESFFRAQASELMSPDYNGVMVEGEAQYTINIHSGCDVNSAEFAEKISALRGATYVFVGLGDDELNIRCALCLRMLFERIGIHPTIHAVLSSTEQKNALNGKCNFKGQPYDIEFIGDIESSYAEDVIIDTELEEEALKRHMKWGSDEESFWAYEYNRRSSRSSAIHLRARIKCGIPGAAKAESDLTPEEKASLAALEHRRWNAYMRAEGYVHSSSTEQSSRNDLGKMHNLLVDYASLDGDIKSIDSRIGTK